MIYFYNEADKYFNNGVIIDELIRQRVLYSDNSIRKLIETDIDKYNFEDKRLLVIGNPQLFSLIQRGISINRFKSSMFVFIEEMSQSIKLFDKTIKNLIDKTDCIFLANVQGYTLLKQDFEKLFDIKFRNNFHFYR